MVSLSIVRYPHGTPGYSAIRAASAGLMELGQMKPAHADLAALIDEQAVSRNELTTRLLQTAWLEKEEVSLKKQNIAIVDLIEEVAAEQAGYAGSEIPVN